jgi:hypothetical protein
MVYSGVGAVWVGGGRTKRNITNKITADKNKEAVTIHNIGWRFSRMGHTPLANSVSQRRKNMGGSRIFIPCKEKTEKIERFRDFWFDFLRILQYY